MARNTHFAPEREPLRDHHQLHLLDSRIRGPFSSLNPTQAHFEHVQQPSNTVNQSDNTSEAATEKITDANDGNQKPGTNVRYKWTSRNNRKGRHALVVKPTEASAAAYATPATTSAAREVLKGIWRMCTYYPIWDVSYLVATVFTLGSVLWVFNAFFVFYPTIHPSSEFNGEILYGGGITAFIGATIFEIGSVLLMLEAVNENRAGCFGWALEQAYDERFGDESEKGGVTRIIPAKDACTHHHGNKGNLVGKAVKQEPSAEAKASVPADGTPPGSKSWIWWPSTHELKSHYLHDLGFLACSAQMFGATVFWIAGFTALPGIYNVMSPGLTDGIYWVPQVIGGSGFVVSGTLFMIETQKHWWQPAFSQLGWWIGLFNLIGGFGFTLCPCFGFDSASWAQYQAGCSTFWGSWAFLIGSVIQWYESLDKHPVEKDKTDS